MGPGAEGPACLLCRVRRIVGCCHLLESGQCSGAIEQPGTIDDEDDDTGDDLASTLRDLADLGDDGVENMGDNDHL